MKNIWKINIIAIVLGLLVAPIPVSAVSWGSDALTFTTDHHGHRDIGIVEARGTKWIHNSSSPVWSPDGRKLLFVSQRGDKNFLYLADSSGSRRSKLTGNRSHNESKPQWSRDGKRIAFTLERVDSSGGRISAVFSVSTDGSREKNISGWRKGISFTSPSWSPDGREIVYERRTSSEVSLLIKNLQTHKTRKLTDLSDAVDSRVSWSPSGKKILYQDSENEVYTIRPDGSRRATIADGDSYMAAWSPDGKQIAFLEDFDGEDISLSRENGDVSVLPTGLSGYGEITSLGWASDGSRVVFAAKGFGADRHKATIFTHGLNDSKSRYILQTRGIVGDLTLWVNPGSKQ